LSDQWRDLCSNKIVTATEPKARLEQDVKQARWVLGRLTDFGISIDKVTQQLEDEGVEKFNKPFDKLMATLTQRSPQPVTRES
jgi:transaldolase